MADEIRSARRDLSALRIERDPGRPRRLGLVWPILVALLLGIGGFLGYQTILRQGRRPEVEVATVRLQGAGEGSAFLSASGYILPNVKADVSSKAFGRVAWLGVDVGSRVAKGEIIARLDNADIAAQVEEAKAALADADREYERWKKIVESGTEPKERFDKVATVRDLARARLKQAEAAYEYTLIRAPFDGIVVKRTAQVGETVGPAASAGTVQTGGSLCTVIDRASLEMVADVNETNIAKVQMGQQAEVVTDARPDRRYRGEVRQVVPTADRQKGIVQVKIRLLDPDDALLPEMAARAAFLREGASAGGSRRVIVPKGAVRDRGGRSMVFVLEGTRVRAVPVEVGAEGEDGTEVRSGLSGGERVVVGGAMVEDGGEVRLKEGR